MKDRIFDLVVGGALATVALAAACGGGTSTPTSPSAGGTGGTGSTSGSATTITIASSGVSPKTITVSPGSRVTFVNNDSRSHFVASDPHPTHTDCPELNQVGMLQPGQSGTSGNLNTVRTCGFHDHDNPGSTALQGSIVIR